MFLSRGDSRSIVVPADALGRLSQRRGRATGCLTIVALAERHIDFTLTEQPRPGATARAPKKSQAGVARIDDCDGRRVGRVFVTMASARGTVEILMAHQSPAALAVSLYVPQRAVGPVAPRGDPGPVLRLAPLSSRVELAERSARLDGARAVVRVHAEASNRGGGAIILKLTEGCHRLLVLAEAIDEDHPIDVDADVRARGEREPLVRDRSHAPDARLDFCLGETGPVELRFAGAGGVTPITIVDGYWPMPEAIPPGWGHGSRAAVGWALHRRRVPASLGLPLYQAVGASGVSFVPVEVEPGRCYVAAFGVTRGDVQAARLSAEVGGRVHHDDATDRMRGAAVGFCAGGVRHARLKIDVRSRIAWWRLAVWRVPVRPDGGAP